MLPKLSHPPFSTSIYSLMRLCPFITWKSSVKPVMPNHRHEQMSKEHDKDIIYIMMRCKERRSRPARVALYHATKEPQLNAVQISWFCGDEYTAAATYPYPTGAAAFLLSSLLRPNKACVAWGMAGRRVPQGSAPESREGKVYVRRGRSSPES